MGIFGKKKKGGGDESSPGAPSPGPGGNQRTMALDLNATAAAGSSAVGWLVPLEGTQAGELFQLKSRCVVGTATDCDVVLTDPSISSRHAEFVAMGGGFRINDLGSTNGTFVNDKRVSSHDLVDNDNVRLGRTPFKFKSMS